MAKGGTAKSSLRLTGEFDSIPRQGLNISAQGCTQPWAECLSKGYSNGVTSLSNPVGVAWRFVFDSQGCVQPWATIDNPVGVNSYFFGVFCRPEKRNTLSFWNIRCFVISWFDFATPQNFFPLFSRILRSNHDLPALIG